jgi:hypothetical protein
VGFRNNDEFLVPHLIFVDDILIFCEANLYYCRHLCCLFFCFEAVSRLKINLAKSELVVVDSVEDVEGFVSILSCRVSSLPMNYLGLLLGTSFKAKST